MPGTLGTISGQVRLDVRQAVGAYAALRAQNARTVYSLRGTGDSFVQAGRTSAIAGGAMVYAFGKVISAAAEFERKMDFASAVSGTTGKKLEELSNYALQLGKDTIFSANEIADGFIELAKSGVKAEDIINGVGQAMTNLGAAGDIPLAQSGQIIVSTLSQFQLEAKDATAVADKLAGVANASIADISDIGVSLKYVGGIAHTSGLELDDVTTAIGLLANAGIRGSTAGTTLRQMIVSLPGNTEAARTALSDLGIITEDGTNRFYDQQGSLKPLSKVYQILGDSMKDLTDEQKTSALRTIFQTRALSAASVLTKAGADGFKEMYGEMSKVTAADVASARLDNLSGDIEILKGNIETLIIQAGGPLQETLRGYVQGITKLVQAFGKLSPETQQFIVASLGIGGAALLVMGAINIVIGTIFKFAASMLKLGAGVKFTGKLLLTFGRAIKALDFAGLAKNLGPMIRNFAALARTGRIAAGVGRLVSLAFSPIGLIILAVTSVIAAHAAAWTFLYKKVEPVRRILQRLGGVIKTLYNGFKDFFGLLLSDPKAAFDALGNAAADAVGQLKKLPGDVAHAVDSGKNKLEELPEKVAVVGAKSEANFKDKFEGLKSVVGPIFDSIVNSVRTKLETMRTIISTKTQQAVSTFRLFIGKLPFIAGYAIGNMAGRSVRAMINFGNMMAARSAIMVTRVVGFFQRLPGRVVGFVGRMVLGSLMKMQQMATQLPAKAAIMVTRVVGFVQRLPARVGALIGQMTVRAVAKFEELRAAAGAKIALMVLTIGTKLRELPGLVGGVISNAVSAFNSAIQGAYNAAKGFADGLWQGFKDGLGINSPSFIEKKMWEIGDVVEGEAKRVARNTRNLQTTARKLAATPLSTGAMIAPPIAQQYASLASTQLSSAGASRTLAGAVGSAPAITVRAPSTGKGGGGVMAMKITNWETGQGYFTDIAQDAIDDDRDYDDTRGRMG